MCDHPDEAVTVDLPAQQVHSSLGTHRFDVDRHTKRLLVEGLDDIGLTLAAEGVIAAFERARPAWMPTTTAS